MLVADDLDGYGMHGFSPPLQFIDASVWVESRVASDANAARAAASAHDRRRRYAARIEPFAGGSQFGKKRRRRPEVWLEPVPKPKDRVVHVAQAELIGMEHRATTPGRKAVAVQPDDVHIHRSRRYTFAQDLRAL